MLSNHHVDEILNFFLSCLFGSTGTQQIFFKGGDSAVSERLMYCSLCCDVEILHVFLYKSEMHRTCGVIREVVLKEYTSIR